MTGLPTGAAREDADIFFAQPKLQTFWLAYLSLSPPPTNPTNPTQSLSPMSSKLKKDLRTAPQHNFGWNAVDIGPKRDLVAELAAAFRQQSKVLLPHKVAPSNSLRRLYSGCTTACSSGSTRSTCRTSAATSPGKSAGRPAVQRRVQPGVRDQQGDAGADGPGHHLQAGGAVV